MVSCQEGRRSSPTAGRARHCPQTVSGGRLRPGGRPCEHHWQRECHLHCRAPAPLRCQSYCMVAQDSSGAPMLVRVKQAEQLAARLHSSNAGSVAACLSAQAGDAPILLAAIIWHAVCRAVITLAASPPAQRRLLPLRHACAHACCTFMLMASTHPMSRAHVVPTLCCTETRGVLEPASP